MVAAQLYDVWGKLLFEKGVFLLYVMGASQLYDMWGVEMLQVGAV